MMCWPSGRTFPQRNQRSCRRILPVMSCRPWLKRPSPGRRSSRGASWRPPQPVWRSSCWCSTAQGCPPAILLMKPPLTPQTARQRRAPWNAARTHPPAMMQTAVSPWTPQTTVENPILSRQAVENPILSRQAVENPILSRQTVPSRRIKVKAQTAQLPSRALIRMGKAPSP